MWAPIAHRSLVLGAGTLEYLAQTLLKRAVRIQSKNWSERDVLLLSNRILGGSHSLIVGLWALREATKDHWTRDDLIFTKSSAGDRIVAVELGYILQDTVFLSLSRRALEDRQFLRRVLAHHAAYGLLMTWWLQAVGKGYDRGIFFVVSFLIMNLSNPLRYLSWAIKKYSQSSHSKQSILRAVHALSIVVYIVTRLGLFNYLIWTYGQRKGLNTVQAFNSLPLVCRCTTSAIVLANTFRLIQLAARWPRTRPA